MKDDVTVSTLEALIDTAVEGFAAAFPDTRREAVWSAPGRVNLIGEHTDYNGGFVFPFAIDRRTVVVGGFNGGDSVRVASSFAEGAAEALPWEVSHSTVAGWSAYPLGVAGMLSRLSENALPGVDLYIHSDVPVGAGLSSSAALESATGVALNDLWHLALDRVELAMVGHRVENEVVGAPTGIMDQFASMLGEQDAAVLLDCESRATELVLLGFEEEGLELLVIDTREDHAHATGGYASRRASCELAAMLLDVHSLRQLDANDLDAAAAKLDDEMFRRVRHVVTENARVLRTVELLKEHGPRAIGPLLVESHVSMRDDYEISTAALDLAVEVAIEAGAIGARMTGGGFGGAAIALVDADQRADVEHAVVSAFRAAGHGAPELFTVHASGGGRREHDGPQDSSEGEQR